MGNLEIELEYVKVFGNVYVSGLSRSVFGLLSAAVGQSVDRSILEFCDFWEGWGGGGRSITSIFGSAVAAIALSASALCRSVHWTSQTAGLRVPLRALSGVTL